MTRWQHLPFSLALITSGIGSPSLFWLVTSSSVFNILFIFNPKNKFWNAILQFNMQINSSPYCPMEVSFGHQMATEARNWDISINQIDFKFTSILRLSSLKKYCQYVMNHPLRRKKIKRILPSVISSQGPVLATWIKSLLTHFSRSNKHSLL